MRTLGAPFRGEVFEQMFSEAIETVTGNILKSRPSITAGELADLQEWVSDVMLSALDAVAFKGLPGYRFDADNAALVSHVATDTGCEIGLTETIISEAYTDSATGEIPTWYENPTDAVRQVSKVKAEWEALQPSFWQRVAGTILSPFGISGSTGILILQIAAGLAVLVALAYVIRTFKR